MPTELFSGLLLLIVGITGFCILSLRRRLGAERQARSAAESRLETLIEYAPIAMAIVAHDGAIRHTNLFCRQLLGYSTEQLKTLDDWWQHAFPDPDARAAAIAAAHEMEQQSYASCADAGPREFRVTCGDGSVKDIECHYVDFGKVGVWTMSDVTDHTRIEEAARLANDHLLTQLAENNRLQEALHEQAIRDPLTTLFNRRYLDETLDREIARAMREGYPVTILMIDIDHFKRLNDTYGHLAGDEMLKAIADLLRHTARQEDIVCRFGGEEFSVILPHMPLEIGATRANELRKTFAAMKVRFGEFELSTTLSAGIAAFPVHGKTRDTLIDTADQALYRAKELGRNRVEVASQGTG